MFYASCVIILINMRTNKRQLKRTGSGFITLAAFFLAVALHAAVIGGVMYASGRHGKGRQPGVTTMKPLNGEKYSMLPDVEIISNKSMLKKSEKQEIIPGKKEDFGAAKQAPAAGGNDDASMFTFENAVQRKIQEARLYPDEAKRLGKQGTAEVKFTLSRDGSVTGVNLIGSSGERLLDEEAVSTIKRAAPYPAFPEAIKDTSFPLQVAIVFKLN